MEHGLPLITTLATALGLALVMGLLAVRLKLPTLVGYLLAGVILGPFTPGFVANAGIAAELAEIGVMLLMFGVGLHFSLDDLLETRKIALPGALLQIVVATCLGALVALLWGWPLSNALVFGLALSVASTVVLIRAMEAQGLLGSINGQIAVGWLIIEDIAMVLALVFLPFLAHWFHGEHQSSGHSVWFVLAATLLKVSTFVALMLLVGRWVLPKLLWQIIRTGSRELFTLCIITVAVSLAFGASHLFGISFALGAFFAGMIIRESDFSRRAAEETLPFREAFAVLFFVSVGMLFNPWIFTEQPLRVLAVTGIIVIGKSIAAALLVLAFRYPINTALTVSVSLAQIGEFSFILAAHGVQLKLLPIEGQELILAGALLSIALNPLLFHLITPMQKWLRAHSTFARSFERPEDPLMELPASTDRKYLSGHVVLVGYGDVGERLAKLLMEKDIPCVIVDDNREMVEALRRRKTAAVYGDAAEPTTLVQAHIARAGMLVVATGDAFETRQMLHTARTLNPGIEMAVRVRNADEESLLREETDSAFFWSEDVLAKSMGRYIAERFGHPV